MEDKAGVRAWIEVVDEQGRVRVAVGLSGAIENACTDSWSDDAGRDRAWVMQDGTAAEVGLDYGADAVAPPAVPRTALNLQLGRRTRVV